jgi:crotonobetainyl-CoA:carnitine CoA-transferase CaiB-like acyl-CoA transferase
MTAGPLSGLKVLDACVAAVGPWAGSILGQLGADVVKLEPPDGDLIRNVMPELDGLSTTYLGMNQCKRGIQLDAKVPGQLKVIHKLASQADVFLQNFRAGVAERIGLGYAELARDNPRLIYAAASGYGWTGPLAAIGATDPHIQALSGSTCVNGIEGGLRERWRLYGHFDLTTSLCIVEAVLAGLHQRDLTGKGARLEITMVEAALALQRARVAEHLAGGKPRPMGSAITYLVPDQAFGTQDRRPVAVTAESPRQWRRLCAAIGKPELADDPRFRTNPVRVANRDVLIPLLEITFRTRPSLYWLKVLREARVPCATFTGFSEFRHNEHYLANGWLVGNETRRGPQTVGGLPWRFSHSPAHLRRGPEPGEHDALFRDGDWPPLEDTQPNA